MKKRKYKIVKEDRPSEDFIRWIPMVSYRFNKNGKIVDNEDLKWEWIPYGVEFSNSGFVKSKDEAENLIDKYENLCLENEGKFIVDEIYYEPK